MVATCISIIAGAPAASIDATVRAGAGPTESGRAGISTPATAALQAATRTIPMYSMGVRSGRQRDLSQSLANPGGNITGFLNIEASVIGNGSN